MPYADKERQREYWREYAQTHKEQKSKDKKKYYDLHKDEINAKTLARYHANKPEPKPRIKKERKPLDKTRQRELKYGINFWDIWKDQDGNCPVCFDPLYTDILERNEIDHCHITGKVRGILHRKCNDGIGKLNDDPVILQRAIEYLRKEKNYGVSKFR